MRHQLFILLLYLCVGGSHARKKVKRPKLGVPGLKQVYKEAVRTLINEAGTAKDREEYGMFLSKVDTLPADPAGLVHFGNMALRCLQLHQYNHLRPTSSIVPTSSLGNHTMYTSTAAFAHHLFTSAARLSGHSGALHSLGVLYKLYPTLVYGVTGTNVAGQGYESMCRSLESFHQELQERHKWQCDGLRLLRPWDDGHMEGHTLLRSWVDPVEAAGGAGEGAQGGYTLHLHRFQDVYMQGSDGLIHDVYRGTPKDPVKRKCHAYINSNGCYVDLQAQLSFPGHVRQLQRAASILGVFSDKYLYHWLLESLPRLLLLHQHLTGPAANLTNGAMHSANLTHQGGQGGHQGWTLILPAGRAGFFKQSLSLVVEALGGKGLLIPPFTKVVWYNGSSVLAIQELLYMDWHHSTDRFGNEMSDGATTNGTVVTGDGGVVMPAYSSAHKKLCAPPSSLQLLRRLLVPLPLPSAPFKQPLVVWLQRAYPQPRSVVNEQEVLSALKSVAAAAGGELRVFNGDNEGVRGALSVLPYAALVVGVHGANLANIAFCYPPTTVIEVTLHEPEFREYEHVSHALGLNYRPLRGQVDGSSFHLLLHLNASAVAHAAREALRQYDAVHLGQQQREGRAGDMQERREAEDGHIRAQRHRDMCNQGAGNGSLADPIAGKRQGTGSGAKVQTGLQCGT